MSSLSADALCFHPSWNVYKAYTESEYLQPSSIATFKCMYGKTCEHQQCTYLHPGQAGYHTAPYYQSETPCQYETETSACRLKCGASNGRYCPYLHCRHASMEFISIRCPRPDCQRHCPHCI